VILGDEPPRWSAVASLFLRRKKCRLFPAVLLIALASLRSVSTARSEEHAYITAEASGKASIVDTHSDTVTSTFDAGAEALGMAASVETKR
jgi:hypothetical protein